GATVGVAGTGVATGSWPDLNFFISVTMSPSSRRFSMKRICPRGMIIGSFGPWDSLPRLMSWVPLCSEADREDTSVSRNDWSPCGCNLPKYVDPFERKTAWYRLRSITSAASGAKSVAMPARKSWVRTTSTRTIRTISTRSMRKMRRSALIGTTIAFWVKPDTSDQVADRGTSRQLLELGDAYAAGRARTARRRGG